LRPYTVVTHVALGVAADGAARPAAGATLPKLFGPPLVAALRASQRLVRRSDDARLERRLYQAGLAGVSVDEHRSRMIVTGAAWGAALGAGGLLLRSPFLGVIFVGVGAVAGSARVRATVDRRIDERRDQLRRELYTVNHMLALHLRTGAGPVQSSPSSATRSRGSAPGCGSPTPSGGRHSSRRSRAPPARTCSLPPGPNAVPTSPARCSP
jgi:hypothetical protein